MKIIVADDEKWVRATIINIIHFEELGIQLAAQASNGLEALALCKELRPEILVTDIKMPGLSGIDLIEELRTALPHTKIIIISGYSDFEYAKSAMNFGVTDYLLKPVDEDELNTVLLKMKNAILDKRKQQEEYTFIRSHYEETQRLMREKFLNQLILPNNLTVENIKRTLTSHNIHLDHPYFILAIFHPSDTLARSGKHRVKQYKDMISKVLRRYLKAPVFSNAVKEYELIAMITSVDGQDHALMPKSFELCLKLVQKHFQAPLYVGISSPSNSIKRLPDLYTQAREALQLKFWQTAHTIFHYASLQFSKGPSLPPLEECLESIILNLRLSDCAPVYTYVDDVITEFAGCNHLHPQLLKDFFLHLIHSIINRIGLPAQSSAESNPLMATTHIYERIKEASSVDKLKSYLKEVLQQICTSYTKHHQLENSNPIEMAKKFIQQNYRENITLEQISGYVYLNPTYFSELFKKEVGMSFVDYRTLLRVEGAKELLTTTTMNIEAISSNVGYHDAKYFSKLFKKTTGMTLFEYRKHHSEK